jgi:hypothetical protein
MFNYVKQVGWGSDGGIQYQALASSLGGATRNPGLSK